MVWVGFGLGRCEWRDDLRDMEMMERLVRLVGGQWWVTYVNVRWVGGCLPCVSDGLEVSWVRVVMGRNTKEGSGVL